MNNVLLIKNPIAGRNSKRIKTDDIVKAFSEHGIECFEKTTTCQGDGVRIAQQYAPDFDAVICCGGDGTYNEVINGMMYSGANVPIIYLPCGSTNDFANTLGLSADPHKAAQMYVEGLINKFDIGSFNDKYFSYIASFGVATDLSYSTSQKFKNLMGHSAYMINGFVIKLIPMLANLKAYHMKIEYDGGVIEDDFYFGAVANTNEVAGLFKLEKENVKMNDGVFEVVLIRGINAGNIANTFFKALHQDYTGETILLLKTSHLKITSDDDVAWTLDGEFGGEHREIDISAVKQGISVVSPKSKFL